MDPELSLPDSADVAIIGAGIIGIATARELLRWDRSVTLIDPEPLSGATWAAAGMLAPVAEVTWDQERLYPLMVDAAALYPGFVADLPDSGYRTTETLVCAGDGADREFLTQLAGLQESMGMAVEPITSRQARRMEPALGPSIAGAMHIPGDHQVDPRRLGPALFEQVKAHPNFRHVAVRVDSVDVKGRVVHCSDSSSGRHPGITAESIVIAAGLNTNDVLPDEHQLPLRPVYGDVIRLRVPEEIRPLLTATVRAVVQGRPVYLVPREDGELVVGATSRENAMAGVSAGGVFELLRDAHHIAPGVWECEVVETIARARPGSPDDTPMVGEIAPGVVVSTGYSRHGILLTPLGAQATTACVMGEDHPSLAAMDPARFTSLQG